MAVTSIDPFREPGSGLLVRLTYVSRATGSMSTEGLAAILAQAQANNLPRGITGTLCFNSDLFLQSIEGSRPAINRLYNKLVADTRHTSVQLLEMCEIEERQWPEWSMGYAVPSSENRAVFLKYSAMAQFQPYTLRASAVLRLLNDLHMLAMEQQRTVAGAAAELPGVLERLRTGLGLKGGA